MFDNCFEIESTRHQIVNAVNNSNLTIGTAYFLFKDIFRDLEKLYFDQVEKEKENPPTLQDVDLNISFENDEDIKE